MGDAINFRYLDRRYMDFSLSFLTIFLYMEYAYIYFIMIRTYKYGLCPNKKHTKILIHQIELCKQLYNNALTERKEAYTAYILSHTSLDYKSQQNELPAVKSDNPEYNDIHSQVSQDALKHLDKAFKNYYNRVKNKGRKGKKAGFPRYKSKDRYNSITYPQSGFKLIHKNRSSKKEYYI